METPENGVRTALKGRSRNTPNKDTKRLGIETKSRANEIPHLRPGIGVTWNVAPPTKMIGT